MMSRHSVLLLLLICLIVPACCAANDPVCVTNESELRQALTDAGSTAGDNEIRLQEGTYFTGGLKFAYITSLAHSLNLSGGWYYDHAPCDFQHPWASATIFDGQATTALLNVSNTANAPGTAVTISNLTLRNGATSSNGQSAALDLFGALGQDLRVQNVVVLSSHNTTAGSLSIYSNVVTLNGWADIYFINNLIADSSGPYANLAIFTASATQTVFMHNNTLSLNGATLPALLDASAGTAFRLVNNAVLGSLNFNSHASDDPIRLWLYDNLGQWSVNGAGTQPLLQVDVGNDYAIDPGFSGALDFRPAAGSPLVNRGLNGPFGGSSTRDLDGNLRVDLGFVDVGAHESTKERIFAGGFDG